MLADHDLPELNPKSDPSTPLDPAPDPPPRAVVVIRERPRSRLKALLPPFLILLAALAILSFRVRSPDWRGWSFPRGPEAPRPVGPPGTAPIDLANETPAPVETEPGALTEKAPEPDHEVDLAESPSLSDLGIRLATEVVSEPEVESVRPEPPDGKPITLTAELFRPLLPEANAVEPAPVAAPAVANHDEKPDPHRVRADLLREARAQADERRRLANLKPLLQQRDKARAEQKKAEREVREHHDALERRTLFLSELRRTLQAGGEDTVTSIRRMIHLAAGEPIPMSPSSIERAKSLALSRNERRAWIIQARMQGIEESAILGDLALAHLVNVVSRTGPRSDDEALLRASHELISVPADLTASLVPAPTSRVDASSAGGGSRFGTSQRR